MAGEQAFDSQSALPARPDNQPEVTLEQYTPENLRYAKQDALSLVVAMTVAYWKVKHPAYTPLKTEIHAAINAMQQEPLDVVIDKIVHNQPLITPPENNDSFWTPSYSTVEHTYDDLSKADVLPDTIKRAEELLGIDGHFIAFWRAHKPPISPRNLLPRDYQTDPATNRLRLLKALNVPFPKRERELADETGVPFNLLTKQVTVLTQELGVLCRISRKDIAYGIIAGIDPQQIENLLQKFRRPNLARKAYKALQSLSPGLHNLEEIAEAAKVSRGNYLDFNSALLYLSTLETNILTRQNPGVIFVPQYAGTLQELVRIIDESIRQTPKFLADGYAAGLELINDPEFVRAFLLQARNELKGYKERLPTGSTRRRYLALPQESNGTMDIVPEAFHQPIREMAIEYAHEFPPPAPGIPTEAYELVRYAVLNNAWPTDLDGQALVRPEEQELLIRYVTEDVGSLALKGVVKEWNNEPTIIENMRRILRLCFEHKNFDRFRIEHGTYTLAEVTKLKSRKNHRKPSLKHVIRKTREVTIEEIREARIYRGTIVNMTKGSLTLKRDLRPIKGYSDDYYRSQKDKGKINEFIVVTFQVGALVESSSRLRNNQIIVRGELYEESLSDDFFGDESPNRRRIKKLRAYDISTFPVQDNVREYIIRLMKKDGLTPEQIADKFHADIDVVRGQIEEINQAFREATRQPNAVYLQY